MNKVSATLSGFAAAFMVYAMGVNAYGNFRSTEERAFANVEIDDSWRSADGFIARANIQNPIDCGLGSLFAPHATLRGEDDLTQSKDDRSTLDRQILCKNLWTGEVFEREFTVARPR